MTNDGIASSLLTSADLATMQARYAARIAALADGILRRAGNTDADCRALVVELLQTRNRLGPLDKLGTGDIVTTVTEGADALAALLAEEKQKKLFTPVQEERIAAARQKRATPDPLDAVFGTEQRIFLRIPRAAQSQTQHDVAAWLQQRGYAIEDYARNHARCHATQSLHRIGKLMNTHGADDWLKKDFENDLTRNPDIVILLTRDAGDIARLSTGRAWHSCLSSDDFHWQKVLPDIRQNAFAAYAIKGDDPDNTEALARMRVLPYVRGPGLRGIFNRESAGDDTLYVCGPPIGLRHATFQETVQTFCDAALNHGPDGTYRLKPDVFADTMPYQLRKTGRYTPPVF